MKLLEEGVGGVRTLQMKVKLPKVSTSAAEPLFKLDQGVADSSAGIACASMAGVKDSVLSRASEIVVASRSGVALKPLPEVFRTDLLDTDIEKRVLAFFLEKGWNDGKFGRLDSVAEKQT